MFYYCIYNKSTCIIIYDHIKHNFNMGIYFPIDINDYEELEEEEDANKNNESTEVQTLGVIRIQL